MIKNLIHKKKEGDYWDFKQEYGDNADLVKDIICFANTVRHKGPRYIIYGVTDEGSISGITEGNGKKQADLIQTLQNANFAGDNIPDITHEVLSFDDKRIEVIVIEDRPHKPYFLRKDYSKSTRNTASIRAGVIYARTQDKNTASDQCAAESDIEKMWRQRFALDDTPLERLATYLHDAQGWKRIDSVYHYAQFPEFTLSLEPSSPIENTVSYSWAIEAIDYEHISHCTVKANFHQTVLYAFGATIYDGGRHIIPTPDLIPSDNLSDRKAEWFYAFTANTLKFAFLNFFIDREEMECAQGHYFKLPIIIFHSEKHKEAFIAFLNDMPPVVRQTHDKIDSRTKSKGTKDSLAYSVAVIERFMKWQPSYQSAKKYTPLITKRFHVDLSCLEIQ